MSLSKGKAVPVTGRGGSHIFWTIGSQMAVRLSALRSGRPPFIPRKIPGTHFCADMCLSGWANTYRRQTPRAAHREHSASIFTAENTFVPNTDEVRFVDTSVTDLSDYTASHVRRRQSSWLGSDVLRNIHKTRNRNFPWHSSLMIHHSWLVRSCSSSQGLLSLPTQRSDSSLLSVG
jgi:hypothetical protein